jgi:hypothetical protein
MNKRPSGVRSRSPTWNGKLWSQMGAPLGCALPEACPDHCWLLCKQLVPYGQGLLLSPLDLVRVGGHGLKASCMLAPLTLQKFLGQGLAHFKDRKLRLRKAKGFLQDADQVQKSQEAGPGHQTQILAFSVILPWVSQINTGALGLELGLMLSLVCASSVAYLPVPANFSLSPWEKFC